MTDSILIVEDEGITALHLRTLLTNWGYAVSAVTDMAEQVVNLIEADPPDLVLMDIRLKGEMDGVEAADIVQKRFNIPVVFLTAHHDDSTRQQIDTSHAYGLVAKPFNDREVYVAVKSALHRRRIELALAREKNGGTPPRLPELGDALLFRPPAEADVLTMCDRQKLSDDSARVTRAGYALARRNEDQS